MAQGSQQMRGSRPRIVRNILVIPTGSGPGAQVNIDLSGIWIPGATARAFYVRDVSGSTTTWEVCTGPTTTDYAVIYSVSSNGDQNIWLTLNTGPDAAPRLFSNGRPITLQITPGSTVTVSEAVYNNIQLFQRVSFEG